MSTSYPSLGKYQITEEIGRGGMGAVYKGYDSSLDRTVAIKLLAPHLVWEKAFLERFLREARAAAKLDHPNIIHVYDVGQDGDKYYFVMAYLPGESLKQRIAEKGRLTPAEALPILRQLADALDYAHTKGLVHRDVKPANVMFSERGQAILTDFGIVKAAQESKLTATGASIGTPQYMAPEQVRGRGVDARTDQYALGIVAFEMLTGRVPFDADTTTAILFMQVSDPPPSIAALCPNLPHAVEGVIKRVLMKSPADRYSSCGEFVEALERVLTQPAAKPREVLELKRKPPPAPPQPTPPPAEQPAPAPTGHIEQSRRESQSAQPVSILARQKLSGWALWSLWVLANWAGWLVAIASLAYTHTGLSVLFEHLLAFGLAGTAVGVGQWLVVRKWVQKTGWWAPTSAVAFALLGLGSSIGDMGGILLVGIILVALGLAQWLILRHQVRKAGWWVPATVLGIIIGSVVGAGIGSAIGGRLYPPIETVQTVQDGVVQTHSTYNYGAAVPAGVICSLVGLITLGLSQWLVLRYRDHKTNWWMLVNAIGLIIELIVLSMGLAVVLWSAVSPLSVVLGGGCIGIINGALTGSVLALLLRQPAEER